MQIDKNICVVGGGYWGKNHIRTLHELGSLGGVVDRKQNILDDSKDKYPDILLFKNVTDAMECGKFSGFIISTPAESHYILAMEIIQRGYHVLVEKPLTLERNHAQELRETAQAEKVNLMVGHLLLFHPAIQKIKNMLDSGIIGKLQYMYSNRLNLGTVRTEENVFWSLAPHDISIFQYLTESFPMEINTTGGAFLQSNIHDTTMTVLSYPDNIKGHIFVSWLHPFKEHRLVVVGSNGMISFEDSIKNRPLKLFAKSFDVSSGIPEKNDGPIKLIYYDNKRPLTEELKYFIAHLDGQPLEIANADSAVEVVDILVNASEVLQGVNVE